MMYPFVSDFYFLFSVIWRCSAIYVACISSLLLLSLNSIPLYRYTMFCLLTTCGCLYFFPISGDDE